MPTLDWMNKSKAQQESLQIPYHLLEFSDSFGDDRTENMLIQGDNLLALKALRPFYAGQVKCIYIDPPYNTQSAFEHYDDKLEHSQWLSMMYPRLELLRDLLHSTGSIWISVDDFEAHYLKVMGDEIFGRENFIMDITWRKRDGAPNDRRLGSVHEHILVWGNGRNGFIKKTLAEQLFNLMPRTEKADAQYKIFAEPNGPDHRGEFRKIDTTANGKGGRYVESLYYPVVNPYTGEEVWPREGTCWRHNREEMKRLQDENRLYWGVNGKAKTPMRKLFKEDAKKGMTTPSIWDDVGLNQHASSEIEKIFGQKAAFETPKPEKLIHRILHIATNPGDIVLDSFLGSGTTAAVAHKMGRRYIGIEMGKHAETHCLLRLKKVVDGEQGGISKDIGWAGGGGFGFYKLGEKVFCEDGGVNPKVKFDTLAAYLWHFETGTPPVKKFNSPLLGIFNGKAYYLLYNGILGDRRANGGNVLTGKLMKWLFEAFPFEGPKIIYGETTNRSEAELASLEVTFKQIPYDIRDR